VRWGQYRAVWSWVEGERCRREGILRHFGDHKAPAPDVPCCDVCAPELVPAAPAPPRQPTLVTGGDLEGSIVALVATAQPPVGRTRAVEILRGGASQVVRKYSYDGLPQYGAFRDLRADDVLARVDELLNAGRLRSTGGRFPKLEVV
jgi:ATP-dependent DNA helicase RecQ